MMNYGILYIVRETNIYGNEKVLKNMPFRKRSRFREWGDGTDVPEFKAFIGIILNTLIFFIRNNLSLQP